MGTAIFGYGGLITPPALTHHVLNESWNSVYKQGKQYPDTVITDAEYEIWEERKDDITLVPAKVSGIRRFYGISSERGGLMLAAEQDEEFWANGVIILGLNDDELDAITANEAAYDAVDLDVQRFQPYSTGGQLSGTELEWEITTFLAADGPQFTTDGERNLTYESRIFRGIEMLAELYGTEFGQRFLQDFLQTTYVDGQRLSAVAPGTYEKLPFQ